MKLWWISGALMMILTAFLAADAPARVRQRSEVPVVHQWRLEDLYRSDQAWRQAKDELAGRLDEILQYRGKLTDSTARLLACLKLSSDISTQLYGDILKDYYGHDQGVCHLDDLYTVEWAYIPHFYYNFYVYQYSTSFAAATALAEEVLAGRAGAAQRYRDFISAGGSDYPIDILRGAGVDMTTAEPFRKTMAAMSRTMDEIEAILAHCEG